MIMARATGWEEDKIKRMPLKVLLQYVHAWIVQEGGATRWVHDDGGSAEVSRQIRDIIERDNEYISKISDES